MKTAWELFVQELREALNFETKLVHVLGEQERESSNQELKRAFAEHRRQTEEHARRILHVMRDVGESPEQAECKGIDGLKQEKQEIMKADPSKSVLDFINVGAGIKVERYEISAYESMIELAQELGALDSAKTLKQTLDEENETLQKLRDFTGRVKPTDLGVTSNPEGKLSRKAA